MLSFGWTHFSDQDTPYTDVWKVNQVVIHLSGKSRIWFFAANMKDPSLHHDYNHFTQGLSPPPSVPRTPLI